MNRSMIEVIKKRYSVRSYKTEVLSHESIRSLREYIEEVRGPFNKRIRLELIEDVTNLDLNGGKIGTYGVIKGAKSYIAALMVEEDQALEELGYIFEKVVLYATAKGLGTCWLGGTFKKSGFEKLVGIRDNEILPIISPIGPIDDSKKRVIDSFIRFAAGSDNRKNWDSLFFNKNFNSPLELIGAGQYAQPLEMVRIAPSASNKQPWRIIKDEKLWHFYLKPTKGYGKALGYDIQKIDMGIAMCHFQLTAEELGLKGKWEVLRNVETDGLQDALYICTWMEEK